MSHRNRLHRAGSLLASLLTGAFLLRLALLIAIAGMSGLLVWVTGIVPVKASSGHWKITHWVLSVASQRSIALHSHEVGVTPPLDTPGLLELGAAHYESGCQWCHGSPDERRPKVAMAMTPAPPYLPDSMDQWSDAELFYIVKHGIKFTGMPAWPSKIRDDDAWPVVAFLRSFPRIDEERYRHLSGRRWETHGSNEPLNGLLRQCVPCHGVDGNRQLGEWVPRLAGQSQAYLESSLKGYARGTRHSGIMETIAARLRPQDWQLLAKHYATQTSDAKGLNEVSIKSLRRGEAIVNGHAVQAARPIPGCAHCHETGADVRYPRLAGQPAGYLEQQLRRFQEHQRGGIHARRMYPTVDLLSEEDIRALARYYASLSP